MTEGTAMKLFKFWLWLLLPVKFYGGGGGGQTAQINPEEQMLADISQEKWDEYKKRYVPLENEWIAKTADLNSQKYHNQASSLASNEVKSQYGQQTQGLAGSMVGGNQGGASHFGRANYLAQANNITQARNQANLGVTDRYLKGTESVIAMGQGKSTEALKGIADVADSSVNGQIKTNINKFEQQQAGLGMYGAVAGAAVAGQVNNSNNQAKKTN
jgi:hypothetical protein